MDYVIFSFKSILYEFGVLYNCCDMFVGLGRSDRNYAFVYALHH